MCEHASTMLKTEGKKDETEVEKAEPDTFPAAVLEQIQHLMNAVPEMTMSYESTPHPLLKAPSFASTAGSLGQAQP
jgi:hypothetical protein